MGNATVDKTSVKAKGMTFTARKRIGSAVTSIVMIAIVVHRHQHVQDHR